MDALCDSEDVIIAGIMQHIEEAGIHSGDSSCVLPAVSIRPETLETIAHLYAQAGAGAEGGRPGQSAVRDSARRGGNDQCIVIEVNPRASRTVPYVSKATGIPLAKVAARLMTGRKLRELLPEQLQGGKDLETGTLLLRQVAGISVEQVRRRGYGARAGDALDRRSDGRGGDVSARLLRRRSFLPGSVLPTRGTVFFSVNDHDKAAAVELARRYVDLGFQMVATEGTANVLESRRA